jgi:hypothetical protein
MWAQSDRAQPTGYDIAVLVDYRPRGTRELLPCGLQWRKLVKLFKKPKSRFYCIDAAEKER